MKIKSILLFAIALIALSGCKKATYLKSDTSELTIPISGQCDTITLQSDVNEFILESAPEWVETNLNDSILIVKVGANDAKAERKGDIAVKNGDLTLKIPVTQQFKATYLNLPDGKTLKLGKEGGTVSIPVESDGVISIENGDDLNLSVQDGKLTLTASKNDGKTIKKKVKLVADDFTEDVEVILEGSVCTKCNGTGKIRCNKCGGKGYLEQYCPGMVLFGCNNCGGSGVNTGHGTVGDMRKGSGKITCPECKGKGK